MRSQIWILNIDIRCPKFPTGSFYVRSIQIEEERCLRILVP